MSTVFFVLFAISLAAVVLSLFAGLLTMARPGEANRRRSNLLMRARLISQGSVVLFFVLFLLTK
ncbi:MAG: twin transmembrane helix small protein [Alphaproteobacteria bacterium]